MFTVNKNVPIPKAKRSAPPPIRRKYPFNEMTPGAMFFVPGRSKNTLSKHASTMAKKMNKSLETKIKFVTRLCFMRETLKGWEPCKEGDNGATQGIGVWCLEA